MDYSRPDLADRLAADYVLGTLRGAARRRFETLLPAHPQLRHAVRGWQDRLLPLTTAIEPETPPPQVWQRIEARLDGTTGRSTARAETTGWWQRLVLWRSLTAFATVGALALAVVLGQPGPATPPVVVVLSATSPQAGAPAGFIPVSFVASISGDGRAMVTRPLSPVALAPDQALELWAVPAEGAPRSLGLISAQGSTVVQRNKVLDNTAALAVSREPPGGSPTGAPTGPVLYVGKLVL